MRFSYSLPVLLALSGLAMPSLALTIDFEQLPFPTAPDYYNGSPQAEGFSVEGVMFNNNFTEESWGAYWEGFAYSRQTELPPIDTSQFLWDYQYVAFPGSGSGGSANYAIVFSGFDAGEGGLIPRIDLPAGALPQSIDVTNVAYAALSMRNGDGFGKKFGGESGTDPDWFRMDIQGRNAQGDLLGTVEFYLADYRGETDTIVDTWHTLDLTPLALPDLTSLTIRFDSSDRSSFGLNKPAYAALDNFVLSVPLAGDFNGDGIVDAADYTVWRNTLGSTDDLAADGNRNGEVDAEDYLVWKAAFSQPSLAIPLGTGGAIPTVPEPATLAVALALVAAWAGARRWA